MNFKMEKRFPEKSILKVNLAKEYEELISSMRKQLNLYEEEHTKLKEELNILLDENQSLHKKLDFEFRRKMKDENLPKILESEMVTNLKNQLDLCKKEKEKTFELYQTSTRLIEKLEDEIRNKERYRIVPREEKETRRVSFAPLQGKIRNAKDQLEMEMANREKLERDSVRYQTELAKMKLNLEANNSLIEDLKEKERKWREKCTRMEQDCDLLSATLECVTKSRNELESKLDLYVRQIQELSNGYNDAKNKVGEALDLVERAVSERDMCRIRESELQKEASKLQLCLEHVIEEAGKKVSEELEDMKKKYESNMHKITEEMPAIKNELERKTSELRKMTLKFKKLQKASAARLDREKISLIKGSETEMAILESQLDSIYKEMERAKLKNEELMAEKARAEDDLSKLRAAHQILLRSKERDEKKHEDEVSTLRGQLQKKVEDLTEFSKRMEFFLTRTRELQTENKSLMRLVENGNSERTRLKKALDIRTVQTNELEEHVESLKAMNEKWKNEIRTMTEEFETRIKEVKKECSSLKKKNWEVVRELETVRKTVKGLNTEE
ncbi:UNVERIFIED_CONTAM: hypothetical protein PYX00_001638 [Menopon gallinae]|uniref:Uncharacterized protein n=1 Tax=Menopon gallinae TaxID=328185 RepID=A0AAW2IES8_9NEOP